ncbi:hypothetical protein E2562_039353, partial [Oryza meyeriana var. granulata]
MICLRAALPFASSSPLRLGLKPSSRSAALRVAAMSSSAPAVAAPIEHIVLIKVRPEAAASGAAAAMVSSLQALSTAVPGLSYIHVGPVLRLRSPAAEALGPTHLLHSRYATKPDLAAYAAHPAHVAAVQGHVLPNALDTTAVDWVNAARVPSPVAPGSAVRLTLAKVKEGLPYGELTFTFQRQGHWHRSNSMMYYNYRTHCSHPQHVLVRCQYSKSSGHVCNLCDTGFRGLIGLRCKACDFDIHETCADYFQPAISFFAHPWHGLALGRVAADDRVCDLCEEACPRGSFVYRCVPCGFDVHPLCTMFPAAVRSPLHPEHELGMVPASSASSTPGQYCLCSGCGEPCGGWFYRCGTCG